ncbi:hypothetical protein HK22_02180 [Gluconobacter sp. DsW_056]|nr:hypothetical protein HK22_02180 [Gluconobacter sp. DsW_056]
MSNDGLTLIQRFEGLSLKAYKDIAGILTIGYGHTGSDVKPGMVISPQQAHELLARDASFASAIVRANVTRELSQGEFDALTSFVFNIGPGRPGVRDGFVWLKNGEHSTLLKLVNFGLPKQAADEILAWNKSNGKSVLGLTRRRQAERKLFLTGIVKPI